jgi:hypothetical protein
VATKSRRAWSLRIAIPALLEANIKVATRSPAYDAERDMASHGETNDVGAKKENLLE